jgi:hypothetical protein
MYIIKREVATSLSSTTVLKAVRLAIKLTEITAYLCDWGGYFFVQLMIAIISITKLIIKAIA